MVEMQFGDFISCGFNQIVNNLAKTHYRWGAAVPVVIRAPIGGGVGAGPFHSQNVESWFTSVAGLKVVAPATPYDAKGLIKAAIRDDDPVIFQEHKYLYRRLKEDLPAEEVFVPLGKARIHRGGSDLTIVTYGAMVHTAADAAEELAGEGVDVEIVDLRTLLPFDEEAILTSVAKTGYAIVLHEAPRTGGFGAEIAATIAEKAFEYLEAPIVRVTAPDTPVPYSPPLEDFYVPGKDDVLEVAKKLLAY
jgi:2-oxoisovalerate dehydrogenase E1 component beta subunit